MLEEQFNNYVSNYDMNDKDIKLKYDHSFRVMKLQEKYAKELGFSKEDIEIAKIIGLLHDFGRFEQLRVYHTYDDFNSIDHADYSVEQLFDKNEIDKFKINKEWYPIIKYAIKNHNKKDLEPCTDERTLMHARLIRDVDKLDIIFLFTEYDDYKELTGDEPISEVVMESIRNHHQVSKKDRKNRNDHIVTKMAFVFDVNSDIVLKKIKGYYKKYYKKLNNKIFEEAYNIVMKYIDERLGKNERIR